MKTPETLVDALRSWADARPDTPALTFLEDGERAGQSYTFAELDRRCRAVAARLQEAGAEGQRVLIVYPQSTEYALSYLGCLYAGAVPAPVPWPSRTRVHRTAGRLRAVAEDAEAAFVLAPPDYDQLYREMALDAMSGFRAWLRVEDWPGDEAAGRWRPPGVGGGGLALLQYTSGSTGRPKGVMITHENLLHQAAVHGEGFGCGEDSTTVTWVPLFHDMGLIGMLVSPYVWGAGVVMMSPEAFVARPVRWLRAIAAYGARHSTAPNFAFELCVRKVGEEERGGLDLSNWSVAINAAEPVRARTIDSFVETYEPYGFRREAMRPTWGLAEATLYMTTAPYRGERSTLTVRETALAAGRVEPVERGAPGSVTLVSNGPALPEHTVLVVDPRTGRRCAPEEVGEIWVSGPCVSQGYWQRPDESEETMRNRVEGRAEPFLRTGDLGIEWDGEIFIGGRMKDLIIAHGQNYFPQDVEEIVDLTDPALRPGCGAAFAVELGDREFAVVVQEVRRARPPDDDALLERVRLAVAEAFDLLLDAVFLIEQNAIPKTSSGKIQRRGTREALLAGALPVVASWQSPAFASARAATSPLMTG